MVKPIIKQKELTFIIITTSNNKIRVTFPLNDLILKTLKLFKPYIIPFKNNLDNKHSFYFKQSQNI